MDVKLQTVTQPRVDYVKKNPYSGAQWFVAWVTSSYAFEEAQRVFQHPADNFIPGYGGGATVDPTTALFKQYQHQAQIEWLKVVGKPVEWAYPLQK